MDITITKPSQALTFAREGAPKIDKAGREAEPLPSELVEIAEQLQNKQYVPVVQGYPKGDAAHNAKLVATVAKWNRAAEREGRSLLFVLRSQKNDQEGTTYYNVWMGNDAAELARRAEMTRNRQTSQDTEEGE